VTGLVGEDLAGAPEEEDEGFGGALGAPEVGGVADEGIDADAVGEGGLAEDVVPGFLGVEVGHGDAEIGVGVLGEAGTEEIVQEVGGEILGQLGVAVDAPGGFVGGEREFFFGADFELEEDVGELGGLGEQLRLVLVEGPEGLEDDEGAGLDGAEGFGAEVLREGLTGLLVDSEPIGGAGRGELGEVGVVGGGEDEGTLSAGST
jgi:hypothetical protein